MSADGWRVPYSGSDCVVYHEGIGHPIGLPHPEPLDDSVMGLAQYKCWLNQTWIETSQKRALGYSVPPGTVVAKELSGRARSDLFTAFTTWPSPDVPRPDQPVTLGSTGPRRQSCTH